VRVLFRQFCDELGLDHGAPRTSSTI
jgi:hypothetical protein